MNKSEQFKDQIIDNFDKNLYDFSYLKDYEVPDGSKCLELIDEKDIRLQQKSSRITITAENVEFYQQLMIDLVHTMRYNNGIGISAVQVGHLEQMFIVETDRVSSPIVFINPRIVDYSTEQVDFIEGCLSYPNIQLKIKRPKSIKVRYETPEGSVKTETFTGLTARVIQHEFQHLQGITMKTEVTKLKWEQARRKVKKINVRN